MTTSQYFGSSSSSSRQLYPTLGASAPHRRGYFPHRRDQFTEVIRKFERPRIIREPAGAVSTAARAPLTASTGRPDEGSVEIAHTVRQV